MCVYTFIQKQTIKTKELQFIIYTKNNIMTIVTHNSRTDINTFFLTIVAHKRRTDINTFFLTIVTHNTRTDINAFFLTVVPTTERHKFILPDHCSPLQKGINTFFLTIVTHNRRTVINTFFFFSVKRSMFVLFLITVYIRERNEVNNPV